MKRAVILTLVTILVPLSLGAQPTIVLLDAKVFTNDPAKPFAEAVAIKGTTIQAVGTNEEIGAIAGGANTKRFRLDGKVVIPGINDAHTHPGAEPLAFNLGTTPDSTFADVTSSINFALDEVAAEQWLIGTIGAPVINDSSVTRARLDKIAPNRKVFLHSFTGHGTIISSAGLQALGVPDNAPDPGGGRFERGADGKINGRIFEYAEYPIFRKLIEITTDSQVRIDALNAFSNEALRFGITSVQAMPLQSPETFVAEWDAIDSPIRLRHIAFPLVVPGLVPKPAVGFAKFNGLKWILDGTPIEKGAALRIEYPTGGKGRENFQSITKLLQLGLDANQQLLLHAAGDQTIATVIKTLENISGASIPAKRVRIEHADGLLPDLDFKAQQLGLIAVLNPTHFFARPLYPAGDKYMRAKTLLQRGIKIAIGSDGPINPYLNIMLATDVNRREEALTREEAVAAYTAGSAFAEFQDQKGVLKAGNLADLAVLSQDIFTVPAEQLPDTRSVLTIIGGKIVFSELP